MHTVSTRRVRSSSSRTTRSRSIANRVFDRSAVASTLELEWGCLGRSYRVGVWPEPEFQRWKYEGGWESFVPNPGSDEFAAAAVLLDGARWRAYLDFAPHDLVLLMENFRVMRLEAWTVATQCPELLYELMEAPTLFAFVAFHGVLRGENGPRWGEVRAVFERGGRWALLDWLGLPATRSGWRALCELGVREPGLTELERLRSWLWSVPGARERSALAA